MLSSELGFLRQNNSMVTTSTIAGPWLLVSSRLTRGAALGARDDTLWLWDWTCITGT